MSTIVSRPLNIRKAQDADWDTVRQICCKTANSGKAIAEIRWPFFGELWVGPYQKFCADWAYVVVRGDQVLGYLTGCPDTRAFQERKSVFFTPLLFLKALFGFFKRNGDVKRFLKRTLHFEAGPEELFSPAIQRQLLRDFPAHLHINIEEQLRGTGVGRELLERYFEDLRREKIPGVHVFCGSAPVAFYEKTGFVVLEQIRFMGTIPVYAMARKV